VIGLADKHGLDRLERACVKALAVGDPSYRTVKGVLAAGLEADPPPPATGDGGAAAFLHGPSRDCAGSPAKIALDTHFANAHPVVMHDCACRAPR
jgi:hypothetical protein